MKKRSRRSWIGIIVACLAGIAILAIALPNLLQSRMAPGEETSLATLRTYLSAQNIFYREAFYGIGKKVYANPTDGVGFPDLYQLGGPGSRGEELKLIDLSFARATPGGRPRGGYLYCDITGDSQGPWDYATNCGLCAYPAGYRKGRWPRYARIIDLTGAVYQKDTGGKPVTVWPDVEAEGWELIAGE